MARRCRFLAARPSQDGRVHPTHWLISTQERTTIGRRFTERELPTSPIFTSSRDPKFGIMRRQKRVRDHRLGHNSDPMLVDHLVHLRAQLEDAI
jgi:hypothetical protein